MAHILHDRDPGISGTEGPAPSRSVLASPQPCNTNVLTMRAQNWEPAFHHSISFHVFHYSMMNSMYVLGMRKHPMFIHFPHEHCHDFSQAPFWARLWYEAWSIWVLQVCSSWVDLAAASQTSGTSNHDRSWSPVNKSMVSRRSKLQCSGAEWSVV